MEQKPKRKRPSKAVAEYKREMKKKGYLVDDDGRKLPKNPYLDKPMVEFWRTVDKPTMMKALKESDSSAAHTLVTYMVDKNVSMSRACRDLGVTLQKLNELYAKHQLAVGMIHANRHLPDIISSTAEDAKAAYELCDRCDGEGTVVKTRIVDEKPEQVTETCPKCRGERQIRIAGDAKAREQIFKMTGVLGEEKGTTVNVNQTTVFGDTLGDTLGAAQRILTQRPQIIDVTAEEVEDDS